MSSSTEPVPTSDQFASMAELVLGHGWAGQGQLEQIHAQLKRSSRPGILSDKRAMGRFMVEAHVLTSEQMTELDNLLQQQTHFPAYHLIKKLGAGGMGTVYLARQATNGRLLAIKTIISRLKEDADFVGRFHRECTVLAGLNHHHIAQVLESGETQGVCFMAMEYVEGPSLATLLKDHKVLPEVYVLQVAKQVAEGLAYVYDKSELVHRDIKPENILMERHGSSSEPFPLDDVAKLIDFGLVKPVDDDERLTQTGMTIGTPLYMSPEQIRGERIDCRSDIYGLGATAYHLLTGTTPFAGTSPGAIMSAHLTQPVPDPAQRVPSLSQRTRDLIMMCMAKKREERFLTFEGLIKALAAALEELGEKQGSAPRLLRKPLVLKTTVKKTAENQPQTSSHSANASSALGESGQVAATNRIVRKFQEGQQATADKIGTAAVHHALGKAQATPGAPAPSLIPKSPLMKPPSSSQLKSAVYAEDPHRQLGTGKIPWIVLGAALAALAAWLVISRL
jgi:eukaryotic-like serine/threonine-protein kinase